MGCNIDQKWKVESYRGKILGFVDKIPNQGTYYNLTYPQHNDTYYTECIKNLKKKGIGI